MIAKFIIAPNEIYFDFRLFSMKNILLHVVYIFRMWNMVKIVFTPYKGVFGRDTTC